MNRKRYRTHRERKADQRLGCIAFPFVNAAVWLVGLLMGELTTRGSVQVWCLWLAWIVNGLILVLSFYYRPALAIGYVASVALTMVAAMAVGGLFLASCIAGLALGLPLEPASDLPIASTLGYLVGLALFLFGLIKLARWAFAAYQDWWSSDEPRKA